MTAEFNRGIDAAVSILQAEADKVANANAIVDPDTGTLEFSRGSRGTIAEDYHISLCELIESVRSQKVNQ